MNLSLQKNSPNSAVQRQFFLFEDEEFLLEMACISLESSGYKVYRAEDGIEAVEVYKAHMDEINLVITDMGLPGMTGAEGIRKA